jgi:hypothetical protein
MDDIILSLRKKHSTVAELAQCCQQNGYQRYIAHGARYAVQIYISLLSLKIRANSITFFEHHDSNN